MRRERERDRGEGIAIHRRERWRRQKRVIDREREWSAENGLALFLLKLRVQ